VVFKRNAHKVMKDAISYARIHVNKKLGSSAIYLTEEQYRQVKSPNSFDIQHLRFIVI
jgi:hypothetical protein